MSEPAGNLLKNLPLRLKNEVFESLFNCRGVRIERILSHGHTSPAQGWYDQDDFEWVLLLQGSGTIEFADGRLIHLKPGDYIEIPAHCRHRVVYTDPDIITIWLAIFWSETT